MVKVLIGVTTLEYSRRADFYDYFNLMNKPENSVCLFSHDRSPAHGRNMLIQAAKDVDCTHILFIDDDMQYEKDALYKLLENDVDIVSCVYLSRAYPHMPFVFDLADDTGAAFPMYLMGEKPRLVPIVAAGFGFLLIKMSVFERMEKPYVRLGELNSEEWCDDIGFFKRVREANIQSYADTTVLCGHIGTVIVRPVYKDGKWYTGYDTSGSGMVTTPQIHPQVEYHFSKSEE